MPGLMSNSRSRARTITHGTAASMSPLSSRATARCRFRTARAGAWSSIAIGWTRRAIRRAAPDNRPLRREIGQEPPPGQEEVSAAARLHKSPQAVHAERSGAARDRVAALPAGVREQRIAFVGQPVEGPALHPGLLHELELLFQSAIEAHEEDALLLASFRPVEPADPDNAVAIGDGQLLQRAGLETFARIGAADMGAKRATQRLGILAPEQEVVVRLEIQRPLARRCAIG